ncbi:HEAT repeat-containing protein 4 [Bagarius yarrelli]|uniref:HEAT repeat-containing protein 4 n=1 Tax=Bagarius yarrelli TaxID=175774 RepID=A0A556V002_BAGYA|nr:HEAT repeat-containing protein 4 [Bagarius yarrelli]
MDQWQQFNGMDQCLSRRREQLYRRSLTNASKGLTFSQDVMWERGPDNIQYSKADFSWLFCASGLLAPITRSKSRKHGGTKAMPRHARLRSYLMPPLTDLPPLRAVRNPSLTSKDTFLTVTRHQDGRLDSIISYQFPTTLEEKKQSRTSNGESVQNKMTKNTFQQIPRGYGYKSKLLQAQYGSVSNTDLGTLESMDKENFFGIHGIAKQMHQPDRKNQDCVIIMDNKNLQGSFSCGLESWTDLPSAGLQSVTKAKMGILEKGVQRRVGLPTKADYATQLRLRPPEFNRQETEAKQPIHYSPMPGPSSLRYAVERWRNAWKIKMNWHSVTIEGLKKDLTDLHWQVRAAAIVTCASAAVNRPKVGPDLDETAQLDRSYKVETVHPELQPLILFALNDPVKRVQLAAAVCQYVIGTPNAQARNILQKALQHDSSGTGADSWVAAQCLAMEGEASQTVTERLISQLFLSNVPSDQEQAAALLASISSKSILVQSLLGEQLNCAEWRNRVLACKIISKLNYPISKDLTNKLLYLMWNDWSGLVRQAAAQTLDNLGLDGAIHKELSVKLCSGPTPWRVEALVLIGQLKIMTSKLLPGFLECLNDEFVVVRNQACLAAASLMIKDEMIQNKLFHLMQNDPSCDVKVAAINALAKISWLTPTLQGLLLWTLQHEKEPSVCIATCEAMKMLEVKAPELQDLLQERLAMETNFQVQRHMEDLMKHCGYSLDGDKGISQMITEQVKKLCTKCIITEKLLLLEDLQAQQKMPRKESWPEPPALSAYK